jgi:hypothetical protein
MRFLASLLLFGGFAWGADSPYFSVFYGEPGAWPDVLTAIGVVEGPPAVAHVLVAREGAPYSAEWAARVDRGDILILEGDSPLGAAFGFRKRANGGRANSLTDVHLPDLPIVWERSLTLPLFELPAGAQVFAWERHEGAPLIAGMRRGAGAVLWVATSPGERGYERFPYLAAALCDLGLEPPFRSGRLWAFFDSAYRTRVDLDYFAARWRKAGIAALHVAAWHFFEAEPGQDAYLTKLIEACHREGILVYAWLELPHVSDRFWAEHPEWREKTALGQDAQLDWRKLMNLQNRDSFRAVASGVRELLARFDWDGVNLAELYFESLEGIGNPARFTPMNADVRREFRRAAGMDPIALFGPGSDQAVRRRFLDFRSSLARRMQEEWIGQLEAMRRSKPYLDVVLTHVDDQFDKGMRDAIGADAGRLLPLLERHKLTFLIEDPATIWNLGPQRYGTIAKRYGELTAHGEDLGIDINIVERYQNVYPTKQQTGTELLELVHSAARSFARVAIYFENSLLPPDLALVPSAAPVVTQAEWSEGKLVIHSDSDIGVRWHGPAMVDDQPWAAVDAGTVWLPAGTHAIERGPDDVGPHLLRLNGALRGVRRRGPHSLEVSYQSESRAIAVLDRSPVRLEVDGAPAVLERCGLASVLLPNGQHVVTLTTE